MASDEPQRLSRSLTQNGSYQAAVVPTIAGLPPPTLSPDTRLLVTEASTEIARFDAELGAELTSFSSVLLRSESAASSKIENLTASAKAIGLAELGDSSRHNAMLIVNNAAAMRFAISLARRLDEHAILCMHEVLLGASRPQWVGHWRNEQVWIGGSDLSPHRAVFVPPHHERVPAAMHDLVAYMAREDVEPLVQAAVAHAQFETVHPFPDGNGRVGRALIHALLHGKELIRRVTVPVSAGLLTDLDGYFGALDDYRLGRPEPIVRLLAEASFAAIGNGRQLIADLRFARERWSTLITARSDATAWKLADLLIEQPVIDSPTIRSNLEISVMTADRAILTLVEAGVLSKVSGNYRNRKYAASEVLAALDGFAARAGRRRSV